jgi:hypothetical protein
MVAYLRTAGLVYPKSGGKLPVSTIHTILGNRLYTGRFERSGKLTRGRHESPSGGAGAARGHIRSYFIGAR